jgi:hypothetical protein
MSNKPCILDSHETSTMLSTWTEYLCVRRLKPGAAIAEICVYEILCEFSRYDEDDNELEIPTEVAGKEVVRYEDGYLVGGALGRRNDDSYYEYTIKDLDDLKEWIRANDFELNDIALTTLDKALRETV